MPATYSTTRTCPSCGDRINLADCTIVATNLGTQEPNPKRKLDEWQLPSGQRPKMVLPKSGYPAMQPSPNRQSEGALAGQGKLMRMRSAPRPTTPLDRLDRTGVARADLPARACSSCQMPLPASLDDREALVLVILGANRVGKSHFIATAFTEAHRNGALDKVLDCSEFALSEHGGRRFYEDYYTALYVDGQAIGPNFVDANPEPFVWDVTIGDRDPFALIVHDLAGEVFADPRLRAQHAGFLRAAHGVIFLADPRDNLTIRADLLYDHGEEITGVVDQIAWDQSMVLTAFLKEVAQHNRSIPVAITVSKADLLAPKDGRQLSFLERADVGTEQLPQFLNRVVATGDQISEYLGLIKAADILRPAQSYQKRHQGAWRASHRLGPVTLHAISALGAPPEDGQIRDLNPLNCVDPLAAVLAQMTGIA